MEDLIVTDIKADDLKVRLLGIAGSGRHGNTDLAVKLSLEAALKEPFVGETDFISLADLNLVPCKGCMKCWGWRAPAEDDEFKCYQSNDDSHMVIKKMKWADGIIMGTPLYNGSASSLLKIVMEKCHCFGHISYTSNAGKLMHKAIGAIVIGITDWSGHALVHTDIMMWGLQMGMWGARFGGTYYTDSRPHRGAMCTTVDAKNELDIDAILKESDKYIPPLHGSMNMRGVRNMGRATAITALRGKAALIQLAREDVKLPDLRPYKIYNIKPEPGSYLDELVKKGELELAPDARAPKL